MDLLKLLLLLSYTLIYTVTKAELLTDKDEFSNVDMEDCSFVSPDVRLPVGKIRPIKYTIKFTVNPILPKIIGEINITITVNNPTKDISLHAYGLRISKSSIKLRDINTRSQYKSNKLLGYRYCSGPQILDLRFDQMILSGVHNITMKFTAPYSSQKGMIRYSYRKNAKLSGIITTQLEPNAARRLFPCWDEPGIKAIFNISVRHSAEYKAFSNMPIIANHSDEESGGDLWWTCFNDTLPMSASHVSITLIDTDLKYNKLYQIDTIWHRPQVEKILHHAFLTILSAKTFWHAATGVNIIFPKIDYILSPNNTINTIGCFGLTIYREKDFLYDTNLDFPGRKNDMMKTITHKIARHWFMGVVTPSWWTDLWLGEALAKLYSYYTVDMFVEPVLMNLYIVQTLQPTLRYDINLRMEPISTHNVNNADEIDVIFYSRLYYDKGVVLLRMLEHSLSQKKFEAAVKHYLKTYELGSATVDDFWTILQSISNQQNDENYKIKKLMDAWLTQKHYPVLYVNNDSSKKAIIITIIGADDYNISDWIIPVTYTVQSYKNFYTSNVTWINSFETTFISLPSNYDFATINQNGYYRVNYDKKTWRKIAEHLNYRDYKSIPVLNRAQLIDDAFYFMEKDEFLPSLFWEISRYLQRETDYIAWYPMFNILSYMSPYLNYPRAAFIRPVILEILDGLLENTGYEEHPYENDMFKSLRLLGTRWACKLGHMNCLLIANTKLVEHLKNSNEHANKILPWWKDWVYCTGMMTANMATWQKLLTKFVATKDPDILRYLCCSENEQILLRYLQLLLSDNKGSYVANDKEFTNIYRAIVKKHIRKNVVLQYILGRYKTIRHRWQNDFGDIYMLGEMIVNVHFDEQFDQITKFAQSQADVLNLNMSEVYLIKRTQKERIKKLTSTFILF